MAGGGIGVLYRSVVDARECYGYSLFERYGVLQIYIEVRRVAATKKV